MPNDTDPSRERQISSDRDAIREWAGDHDAVPVREPAEGSERDQLRIVPEREARDSHERVEWETFFDELDEGDQVVVYHGETADDPLEVTGQRDLVGRVDDDELEERLMQGETVTSEITETRVVESVVVEELTVESELVDTQQVEGRVVDAELVDLACPSATLQEVSDTDASDWFDAERYLDAVGDVGTMAATGTDADAATRTGSGTETSRTDAETMGTDAETPRTDAETTRTDAATGTEAETPPSSAETTQTDAETTPTETETTPTETEPTHTDAEARRETEERIGTDTTPTDAERTDTADVGSDATEDRTTSPGEHTASVTDRTEEPGDRTRDDDHTRTTGSRRRSLEATTGPIEGEDFPYRADLEVEETWAVTREVIEQYVVESHVTDKEVTEADSIEDYDLDAAELHRSILDQELFETERPSDEVLAHYDVESELSDPDRIQTTFTNERQVQDRIVDRKRLDAAITGGDYTGMDLVESRIVGMPGTEETAGTTDEAATAGTTEAGPVTIDDGLVGNTVRNAAGDEIGMVSEVDESTDQLFVDVQPGIAERIMATLGWSDADSEDYSLGADAVRRVDDDEIWLKGREEIEGAAGDHA